MFTDRHQKIVINITNTGVPVMIIAFVNHRKVTGTTYPIISANVTPVILKLTLNVKQLKQQDVNLWIYNTK